MVNVATHTHTHTHKGTYDTITTMWSNERVEMQYAGAYVLK